MINDTPDPRIPWLARSCTTVHALRLVPCLRPPRPNNVIHGFPTRRNAAKLSTVTLFQVRQMFHGDAILGASNCPPRRHSRSVKLSPATLFQERQSVHYDAIPEASNCHRRRYSRSVELSSTLLFQRRQIVHHDAIPEAPKCPRVQGRCYSTNKKVKLFTTTLSPEQRQITNLDTVKLKWVPDEDFSPGSIDLGNESESPG